MLVRQAVRACNTPCVTPTPPPPVGQSPVLRRGVAVDNGGLLKAITSAKSNRSDQAVTRTANRDRIDDADLLQVHLATGFPVPLPRYPWSHRPQASELRQRIRRDWADRELRQRQLDVQRAEEQAAQRALYKDTYDHNEDSLLQPVFRASPYLAEVLRAQCPVKQANILFLDEGNQCRSVLAEAVFKDLVSMSPLNPFICVDSASIGPAVGKGLHDPRVMWAAQKAGLTLSRRNIRPFDEQVDIVNYDLVLTMDHFDHDEVYREVAVFENMNPGGAYSNRIQQLGTFASSLAKPQQRLLCEDINDPLYGNSGSAQERAALLAAVHELRIACRGLLQKLMLLQTRCINEDVTMQVAIAESLQSPVPLDSKALTRVARGQGGGGNRWPVWRKNGVEEAGHFYTIRVVKGQRQVVKRRSAEWGYWRDVRNVKQELQRWLKAHPLAAPHLLPSQSQLRRTRHSSLAVAVTKHGGYKNLFAELPAERQFSVPQRKNGGHWNDFEVVRGELQPFLHIIDQGPDAQHLSAKAGSLTPDGKPCVKSSRDAFDSNILAAHSSGASHGSSGGSTAARIASVSLPRGNSTDTGTAQDQLPSNGAGPSGVQAHHRMPTQQELVAAGRMDLLNAIRLWGGFTAVADLMGVRPNTRHKRSPQGLREEVQEVIRQQQWPAGLMPSASQLQAAGQHRLIAAIRQRGGFKTIAAQLGLTPRCLDKRGRKPKKLVAAESVPPTEPALHASVELFTAPEHSVKAYRHPNRANVHIPELLGGCIEVV